MCFGIYWLKEYLITDKVSTIISNIANVFFIRLGLAHRPISSRASVLSSTENIPQVPKSLQYLCSNIFSITNFLNSIHNWCYLIVRFVLSMSYYFFFFSLLYMTSCWQLLTWQNPQSFLAHPILMWLYYETSAPLFQHVYMNLSVIVTILWWNKEEQEGSAWRSWSGF